MDDFDNDFTFEVPDFDSNDYKAMALFGAALAAAAALGATVLALAGTLLFKRIRKQG